MTKQLFIGTVAVFVLWEVLDVLMHGLLLGPSYAATAQLWRPMEEMSGPGLHGVRLVSALCFTLIFALGFAGGGRQKALLFGLWFGLSAGVSMGFGTYFTMPVPLSMAVVWMLGTLVEALLAALTLDWVHGRWGVRTA